MFRFFSFVVLIYFFLIILGCLIYIICAEIYIICSLKEETVCGRNFYGIYFCLLTVSEKFWGICLSDWLLLLPLSWFFKKLYKIFSSDLFVIFFFFFDLTINKAVNLFLGILTRLQSSWGWPRIRIEK